MVVMIFQTLFFQVGSALAFASLHPIYRERLVPRLGLRTRDLQSATAKDTAGSQLLYDLKTPVASTNKKRARLISAVIMRVTAKESVSDENLLNHDAKFRVRRSSFGGRAWCGRCHRPEKICICSALPKDGLLDTRTRVVLFVHPEELKRACGTAVICKLCLKNLIIKVGERFPEPEEDPELHASLTEGGRNCLLVYPGEHSEELRCPNESDEFLSDNVMSERTPATLIFIDSRWGKASGMFRRSAWLQHLPSVALVPTSGSRYFFRKQRKAGHLSTLEAVSEALLVFEGSRGPALKEELLAPFLAMVQHQRAFTPESMDKNAMQDVNEKKSQRIEKRGPKGHRKGAKSLTIQ